MHENDKYIMALDLSLSNTGIAIFNKKQEIISIDNIITNPKDDYPIRLKTIFDEIKKFEKKYSLSTIVFERSFSRFHKSTQSLFRVQGVAMLALYKYSQFFYSPSEIKSCLTGKGNASKQSVLNSVQKIYPKIEIDNTDQSDAIATGVTYFRKEKFLEE